jgi:hypothetical protein
MTRHLSILLSAVLATGLTGTIQVQLPSQLPSMPIAVPDQSNAIRLCTTSQTSEQSEQWQKAGG